MLLASCISIERALGGRRRRVQATGDPTTVGTFQRLWDRFLWDEAKSPKILKGSGWKRTIWWEVMFYDLYEVVASR
jgi:hypothetical protein